MLRNSQLRGCCSCWCWSLGWCWVGGGRWGEEGRGGWGGGGGSWVVALLVVSLFGVELLSQDSTALSMLCSANTITPIHIVILSLIDYVYILHIYVSVCAIHGPCKHDIAYARMYLWGGLSSTAGGRTLVKTLGPTCSTTASKKCRMCFRKLRVSKIKPYEMVLILSVGNFDERVPIFRWCKVNEW